MDKRLETFGHLSTLCYVKARNVVGEKYISYPAEKMNSFLILVGMLMEQDRLNSDMKQKEQIRVATSIQLIICELNRGMRSSSSICV